MTMHVLHLKRLYNAPDLYLKCVNLVTNKSKANQEVELRKFLHKHDPWLEVDNIHSVKEHKWVVTRY